MTCGMTVAPMIPVASRMLSVPAKPGTNRCLATCAAVRVRLEDLEGEGERRRRRPARDHGLEPAEPLLLQAEDRERAGAGEQAGREQRDPEEQVEAQGGADDLGDVAGGGDDLRLDPEADRGPPGERVPAGLGQVPAGRDPELRRLGLDDHRDQVGAEHDPEQQVAELGPARDVGGEVARVDVGDGGDEGRAQERPDPRQARGRGRRASARAARATAASPGSTSSTVRLGRSAGPAPAAAGSRLDGSDSARRRLEVGSFIARLAADPHALGQLRAERMRAARDLDHHRAAEGLPALTAEPAPGWIDRSAR